MSGAREVDPSGEPPRTIDGYRLDARLAEGGSSEVWRAWDTRLERAVALKLSTKTSRGTPLEREASLLSRLDSPHTVRVFGAGSSDGGLSYLAMEYLAGADLALARAEPWRLADGTRARFFGAQACVALAHVHGRGVVHGDVKPRNFVVSRFDDHDDFLKLVDFGIARTDDDDGDDGVDDAPKRLRGTPAYFAPELVLAGRATPSSDLYALGATLYFLVTGAPPFVGDEATILEAHLGESPERPSQRLGRSLPSDFEETVLACLAKEPSARPTATRTRSATDSSHAPTRIVGPGRTPARSAMTAHPEMLARWEAPTV